MDIMIVGRALASFLAFRTMAAWCAIAMLMFTPLRSEAQCPDSGDTLYVLRVTNFFAGCFGRGATIGGQGPSNNVLSQPLTRSDTVSGVACTIEQHVNLSADGKELSVTLSNRHHFRASYDRGVDYGGGFAVTIEAYLKAPPNTRYWVTRRLQGRAVASHGGGPGRTDAWLLGAVASGVNGTHMQDIPVNSISEDFAAGVTSNMHPPGRPEYSLATTIGIETLSYTCQSIPFCFPPPCPTVDYDALTELGGTISVGQGNPPCLPRRFDVTIDPCMPRDSFAGTTGVQRHFVVTAEVAPNPPGSNQCGCCEYRQFVRELDASSSGGVTDGMGNFTGPHQGTSGVKTPMSPGPNGGPCTGMVGSPVDGPCPVEDTACKECQSGQSGCTPGVRMYTAYGHRDFAYTQHYFDDAGATMPNRLGGCFIRTEDYPNLRGILPGIFRYELEFEGQIIVRSDCSFPGAPADRVVARKHWGVCCSGTAGTPPVIMGCGAPFGPDSLPTTRVRTYVDLAGRNVVVTLWRRGSLVWGNVGFDTDVTEMLTTDDVALTIGGMSPLISLQPVLMEVESGIRHSVFRDVAFVASCVPSTSSAQLIIQGQSLDVTLDFTENGTNFAVADLDNGSGTGVPDGGVTIEDLLYFLDRYAEGSTHADLDNGISWGIPDGGVTIEDLLYFLVRYEAGC